MVRKKEKLTERGNMGLKLLVSDFIISFMWVWSSVLINIFVSWVGLGAEGVDDLQGEILKHSLALVNMFFFAFLSKATDGGNYNPLTILPFAISENFTQFLFTVGARIPAQVTQCSFAPFFLFNLI